jgi:hypothetical protein
VPYALHAKTAGSILNPGADLVNDADSVLGNEYNTTVVLNGTDLETTDGGGTITTDLSSLVDDADASTTNELNTTVVLNGTNLETTDAGGTITTDLSSLVDDGDASATNELNTTVVLNGTNLETTDGGGTITTDLSSLMVNADTLWTANGADISNLNTGNVGIGAGAATPARKLHVDGDALIGSATSEARIGNVGHANHAGIAHDAMATPTDYALVQSVTGVTNLNSAANQNLYFKQGNVEKMRIATNGDLQVDGNSLVVDASTNSVGIGTTAPSATLDVEGDVQIVDGTEGVGKVLTSDAAGNATWTGPVGFKVTKAANGVVAANGLHTGYTIEEFDYGNGWNTISNRYIAPVTGLYKFELNFDVGANLNWLLRTYLQVGGVTRSSTSYRVLATNSYQEMNSHFLVYLTGGQSVTFRNGTVSYTTYGSTSTTTAEYSTIQGWLIK